MNNNVNYNGGIGFFGLLQLIFIVLKLTDVINWSWWWVLAPTWGPLIIIIGIVGIFLIHALKND